MQEAAPELVFEERLPNPTAFADVSDERSLKVLVYRAPELAAKSATPPAFDNRTLHVCLHILRRLLRQFPGGFFGV
jgi:hypothetical protein